MNLVGLLLFSLVVVGIFIYGLLMFFKYKDKATGLFFTGMAILVAVIGLLTSPLVSQDLSPELGGGQVHNEMYQKNYSPVSKPEVVTKERDILEESKQRLQSSIPSD